MPSRLRGQLGWALLIFAAGHAVAAEGLPPLQVDPALLGAPLPPRPPAAVAPAPAAPVAAPPAPPVNLETPRKIESLPAQAAAPSAQTAPAATPAQTAPTSQPAPTPQAVAAASPAPLSAPPVVAERPAVPATYSALAAAGELPAPKLKASRALEPADTAVSEPLPTFVRADRISGQSDVETVAEGDVELRRRGKTLDADRLTYWQAEDEVDAVGHVRLATQDDIITGPHLRMKIEENTGYFEKPEYTIKRVPVGIKSRVPVTGSGEADRMEFEGEGVYGFRKGTYSTCSPIARDWYVQASDIQLDYNREVGEAKDAKLVFEGVPILYSPWLNFSLNNERKSGLLTPTLGSSSLTGLEMALPWYWNIAPNMDATITPRDMAKRGLQVSSEFRYLNYNYSGQDRFEVLPDDQVTGTRRYAYSLLHTQNFGQGLTGNLNVNGASDGTYFTDLSTSLTSITQTNLLRQGSLTFARDWWNTTLTVQRFQTLQDPNAPPVAIPYYRLPWWTINATRPDLPAGLVFGFNGEYVDFSHPTQVIGKRTMVYPQLSMPLQTAAFYVTPKIGIQSTRYFGLERQAADVPEQMTRNVPIFNVDSGVVFERNVDWFGKSLTQTLEPRLYYLYVPNRDQSKIPVFDTGLADFNFAQIFAENRYSGGDRIADANQLTTAVTSRVINPETGAELLRGALGTITYFSTQNVTLPGEVPRTGRRSDYLAAFTGQVMPKTFLDTGILYNPTDRAVERFNLAGRYQPETAKVLNAGYRYTRDQLGQIDISGQWPLGGRWYGVGRYNYSTKDGQLLQSIGGLEYNAGCWIARFVVQRLAVLTGRANTTFYVQLELNGFTKLGSNPEELLRRNVPGYGPINQPSASAFGTY